MKKLIIASITAVVVITVMAGMLVPILDDATTTHETFTNKGRYFVDTSIDDDVTITMNYDIEDNVRSWYIDGVLLEYDDLPGAEYIRTPTVTGTDNFIFRTDGRYRGLTSGSGNADYTVTVNSTSITMGANVGNAPLFVASTTETDNIMRYSPDTDMYILKDSDIIGCGYTLLKTGADTQTSTVVSITGSVEDGVTVTLFNGDNYTFTTSNVKLNVTEVNGYEDLYLFDSVTFDATYNDGSDDYVTSCTYSMVVLPSEVTAERTVHFTDGENAIFNAIPVMVIVALLLAIVAMVLRSRMD